MSKKNFFAFILLIVAVAAIGIYWSNKTAAPDSASEEKIAVISKSGTGFSQHGPVPNSIVRLRTPSFALSLHPLKMADVESRQIATLLHGGLIFQDDTGEVKPILAESWTHTDNEWRFKLKTGVKFSDGTPVTLSDVVASICNAMQPTSPWAWALKSIRHELTEDGKAVKCSGLEIDGEGEVKIVENRPSAALLDALSGPAGWILPANASEQPYGVVPGIGPYKVKEIVADNRVVLQAWTGGAIQPRVETVQFNYIADDSVAASQFLTGQLDVLDLTSPQLVDLVVDPTTKAPKGGGSLQQRNWDRVRILIVNKKRLAYKGLTKQQIRSFIDAYASSIDRKRIAELSKGTAIPLTSPYPPVPDITAPSKDPSALPIAKLTILTEPDAYSDLIAASLPSAVGRVTTDYKGVDKAVLIDSLVKGNFDIASIVIEATVHSPDFWDSFFTPGNPFTAFGTPIEGMQALDVQTEHGLRQAGNLIVEEGNWIGVLRERRLEAVRPGISDILFSASGQTNYAFVSKQ